MPSPEPLGGTASDYDILPGGIPRNRKTGELGRAGNTNGYVFYGHIYNISGNKFVPAYPVPVSSGFTQADLDKARADGRAEGIAAVRAALAVVR